MCLGNCSATMRRFVPTPERMAELLAARCVRRKEGWVFPSALSRSGHIQTVAKGSQALRIRAGGSSKVVLYSAVAPTEATPWLPTGICLLLRPRWDTSMELTQ